jgi:hypothetical protein
LKTIKKAITFILPFLLKDDGSPKLTGTTLNTVDTKVLDFMSGLLKGKNVVDDVEEDDAKEDFKAKAKVPGEGAAPNQNQAYVIHPSNWSFCGWWLSKCLTQQLLSKSAFYATAGET